MQEVTLRINMDQFIYELEECIKRSLTLSSKSEDSNMSE